MTRIAIDLERPIGRLNRAVFGGFIEHLGRCIYGGLYAEQTSPADEEIVRQDVLDLLLELRISILRWPGGNFASTYHWADGIGPMALRPRRRNIAWGGVESNHFGTDEFIAYCRRLAAEPYICLNMGNGSLAEAMAWVEYCNGAESTYWSDKRVENASASPHGVRWWGLGNEMYGEWQVGALSAEAYVSEATRWARALRMVDPDIRLVSCGMNGWNDWDRVVIEGLASLVDLHSVHLYTGSADYWTNVLQPHQAERAIAAAKALIERTAYVKRIASPPRIAYDEWNVWYRTDDGSLEERYDFSDALAIGTYLNIFVRNCDWVRMANWAQLVNAIAPIVTSSRVAVAQPIYYPFALHAQGALDLAVDAHVYGPNIDAKILEGAGRWPHRISDLAPFKVIDAAATVTEDHSRLAVTLVNRARESAELVEIVVRGAELSGEARVRTVTSENSTEVRRLPDVEGVSLEDSELEPRGSLLTLLLPPQSFALVEAERAKT